MAAAGKIVPDDCDLLDRCCCPRLGSDGHEWRQYLLPQLLRYRRGHCEGEVACRTDQCWALYWERVSFLFFLFSTFHRHGDFLQLSVQ